MLKLLESPYDLILELNESDECTTETPLHSEEESQTTSEKHTPLNSTQPMSRYFSKPPEWSLGLCVT